MNNNHPILNDSSHPLLDDVNCHPILDDSSHPHLTSYIQSRYRIYEVSMATVVFVKTVKTSYDTNY